MKLKRTFLLVVTLCMFLPTSVSAQEKSETDTYLGEVLVDGDPTFDSDSIKNSDSKKWHWMSYPESRMVIHPQETKEAYKQNLNLHIGLLVNGIFKVDNAQTIKLENNNASENTFVSAKSTWYPYQYQTNAEYNNGKLNLQEYFVDKTTLVRMYDAKGTGGKAILSSDKAGGTFSKHDTVTMLETNTYFMAYKVVVLKADGSVKEVIEPIVSSDSWKVEIPLDTDQKFAISMTLGVKGVAGESADNTISRANKATNDKNYSTLLANTKEFWDKKLAKVPTPTVWGIQGLDDKGVTKEQHRRSFYAAWTYQYQNILEETPETGYNYKQVTLGKASMWNAGVAAAPNSCAWESFFDIQALAMVEPGVAWSAVEGFIHEIDENGILNGECLPSQKAHTVWVCHSYKPDVNKLKKLYPNLKNYLTWRYDNPRWIYGGHNYKDEKDLSFITQWYSDVDYVIKICKEIGMESDIAMWEQLKEDMYENMRTWFFSDPTGQLHWTYFTETGENYKYDRTEDVDNYIIGALSIEGLPQDMRQQLIDYYVKLHDTSKDLVGFNFYKYGDGSYIAYGLLEEGLRNTNLQGKGSEFINAVLRNIVKSVEFSEESKPDQFGPSGVQPSTFTASAMIDYTYLNNGVRIDQGEMSLFNVGKTKIDKSSIPTLETSILKSKRPILPKTIEVKTKDGDTIDAFVTWEEYDVSKCDSVGEFTIKGVIAQSDLEAKIKVRVYGGEVKFEAIERTIMANTLPELPNKIVISYTNNDIDYIDVANVIWEELSKEQFTAGNMVKVQGKMSFNNQTVEATIKVLGDLTIVTENGVNHVNRYDTTTLQVVDTKGNVIDGVTWSIKNESLTPAAGINSRGRLLAVEEGKVTVVGTISAYNAVIEKEIIILPKNSASLAYHSDITVTSIVDEARNGPKAVDGDINTMWRAKENRNQVFISDLGKNCELDGISTLWFEETQPKKYRVSVSTDNSTWEEVSMHTITGSPNKTARSVDVFNEVKEARYIKLEFLEGGGYETGILEFAAHGRIKGSSPMTDMEIQSETGQFIIEKIATNLQLSMATSTSNADTRVHWEVLGMDGKPTRLAEITENGLLIPKSDGEVEVIARAIDGSGLVSKKKVTMENQILENVALKKTASASTNSGKANEAIDGDRTTRWGTSYQPALPIEFKVDLGQVYNVQAVIVYCDTGAYPIDFEVQYWDGSGFVNLIPKVTDNNSPNFRFDFDSIDTSAVRIVSSKTTNPEWGFSIWEFELYGNTSKAVLNNLYGIYKDVDETMYKPNHWPTFVVALENAKTVIQQTDASSETIQAAITSLQDSFASLELRANMIILMDVIEKAQTMNTDNYTPNTVHDLEEALHQAIAIYDDKNSTQEAVDAAKTEVLNKIEALIEQANMTELEAEITKAEAIDENLYTPKSIETLDGALVSAKAVLADKNATQKAVDNAKEELISKLSALVKRVDTKELEAEITKAETIDRNLYTPKSIEVLDKVLVSAKEVFAYKDATEDMILKAKKELIDAMNALVKRASTSDLQKTIKEAEAISLDSYTKESVQALQKALDKAKAVLANEDATDDEISEANQELINAIKGLIKKSDTNGNIKPSVPDSPNKGTNTKVTTSDETPIIGLGMMLIVSVFGYMVLIKRKKA